MLCYGNTAMKKHLIAILAILLPALVTVSVAEARAICMRTAALDKLLKDQDRYLAVTRTVNQIHIETWVNANTGQWMDIVREKNGRTCVTALGENWEVKLSQKTGWPVSEFGAVYHPVWLWP